MNAQFGVSAQRLAGLAGHLFGWSADAFWNATPEELATLLTADTAPTAPPPDAATLAQLMKDHPDG